MQTQTPQREQPLPHPQPTPDLPYPSSLALYTVILDSDRESIPVSSLRHSETPDAGDPSRGVGVPSPFLKQSKPCLKSAKQSKTHPPLSVIPALYYRHSCGGRNPSLRNTRPDLATHPHYIPFPSRRQFNQNSYEFNQSSIKVQSTNNQSFNQSSINASIRYPTPQPNSPRACPRPIVRAHLLDPVMARC